MKNATLDTCSSYIHNPYHQNPTSTVASQTRKEIRVFKFDEELAREDRLRQSRASGADIVPDYHYNTNQGGL
jgi:hypothetical protein